MTKPAIMTDVPELADELNRKTIESIEYLVDAHSIGQISDDAYQSGLRTVNRITRGLVDRDINQALDQEIDEHFKEISETVVLLNFRTKKTLLVRYVFGDPFYCVKHLWRGGGTSKITNNDVEPQYCAYREFKQRIKNLEMEGYVKI